MRIIFLAPKVQEDDKDYGDSIIIDDNGKIILFDCGSEELANQVLEYLSKNNIEKLDVVLSHNDSDHFDGIQTLVEAGVVNSITTLLLLKYKDEIFNKIKDGRVTKDSLEKNILELYSNIKELSGDNLQDALEYPELTQNIKVVGPSESYFVDAVAKQFTPTESDNIDKSTIMNAISVQLEVNVGKYKLLMTGDADIAAFDDKLYNYEAVQLPHHGNPEMAEAIFELNDKRKKCNVLYLISDNKGKNINGGSDKLITSGHRIKNTHNGSFEIASNSFEEHKVGNLGIK